MEKLEFTDEHQILRDDWFLKHLFNHLPVDELKNCRLVSKKWRNACESVFQNKSAVWFGFGNKNEHFESLLKGFQELQNSPSGFSHKAFHFCCNTPFPWTNALTEDFFKRNGENMKFLHVGMGNPRECKSQPKSAMADFIYLLNILFEHATGLERLTLYWEFFGRDGVCEVDMNVNYPERKLDTELSALTSLSLETDVSRGDHESKGKIQSILSETMKEFLSKTRKLETILITNSYLLNSMAKLDSFIATVKRIDLQVWNDVDDLAIDAVLSLGNRGIRLRAFSMLYKEHSKRLYSTLIQFLASQKKSLEKLCLCLQNFEKCGVEKLPRFPRMERLEKLHVSSFAEMSFENTDWISQFPNLKFLEYSYTNHKEPFGYPFVNFLNDNSLRTANVTFVKVNANTPLTKFSGRHMHFTDCVQLFHTSKTKFPNLKHLMLCDGGNSGKVESYLYNGVLEDAITLFRAE